MSLFLTSELLFCSAILFRSVCSRFSTKVCSIILSHHPPQKVPWQRWRRYQVYSLSGRLFSGIKRQLFITHSSRQSHWLWLIFPSWPSHYSSLLPLYMKQFVCSSQPASSCTSVNSIHRQLYWHGIFVYAAFSSSLYSRSTWLWKRGSGPSLPP